MGDKLISPEDFHLFKLTSDLQEARDTILRFYRIFHSYRFVGPYLVIRLQQPAFRATKRSPRSRRSSSASSMPPGEIFQRDAYPQESNEPEHFSSAPPVPEL